MGDDSAKTLALREAWQEALMKDRLRDALAALDGLELLEPNEPRWPHRKGDVLRRLGRPKEAEESLERAVRCYMNRGFFTRAAALAKVLVELDPARAPILEELNPAPAKQLRDEAVSPKSSPLNPRMPPPPRLPSGTMPAVRVPPIPREEPIELPKTAKAFDPLPPSPDDDEHPSVVAGVRADRISVVASAMALVSANDVADDEVRFVDVPDVYALDVDLSELEESSPRDSSPELEVEGFDDDEAPTAVRLALMSGASLFVDVPKPAMSEMVAAASLVDLTHGVPVYRRGEHADGLYVVVEGKVDLVVPGTTKKLVVTEGSVFGEDALLEGGVRNADTRVSGRMLALKIPKVALDEIVQRHASLGDVLFDVLVRRLLTMSLQTSPLFAVFDLPTRKELARLFEVRRAAPNTIIKQKGKRSDGLYLPLAGELEARYDETSVTILPLGTMFGHTSLLSDEPEERTIRTRKESVVLRLPAARFLAFAARVPTALAHLAALAREQPTG
ncbi:MAG: cyclic nucleotide-binding domain-containing protein [Labilithrix sp.]|nr:cyclic nucleotide-binding domain-containing protein [Labilithrix sp.]